MVEEKKYKKKIGEKAVEFIEGGMTVGLGSGSTVYWMLRKLGELVQHGLEVKGIPSSLRTERWANEFGIPLIEFSKIQSLDLAIDGADEIDQNLNLIKGGGGSLVREKIVDGISGELIIIADASKLAPELGNFPLPIEVLPFGWEMTARKISRFDCVPQLRKTDEGVFISDNGNYILDCEFNSIPDPAGLHRQLKFLTGVVETGLFVGMTEKVITCDGGEILILGR